MSIRISPDLTLPRNTVTATLVAYGGKGMGKTNLGSVVAEELAAAGLRWAWLDPLGVSWGLRHDASGKGRGVECLILGGTHGDIPIEPSGGAAVADVVVEEAVNVLIDFSRKPSGEMWSKGDRVRFITDYAARLFQRQGELVGGKKREPLMQVLDEAARYIPQVIPAGDPGLARCVGAWEQIVEEGRNVGLGVFLLTQRSARMNKSVSELADAMFAFRTVGPNSLDAILDWLGTHVEKARIKDLAEQIRQLDPGSAMVVSPGWLKYEGVIHVRLRTTFDSSATPDGRGSRMTKGDGAKPDLKAIQARMADTIERAKAEDPRELRKTIAGLRAELAAAAKAKPATAPAKGPAPKPALQAAAVKRLEAAAARVAKDTDRLTAATEALDAARDRLAQAQQVVTVELGQLRTAIARANETSAREGAAVVHGRTAVGPAAAATYVSLPAPRPRPAGQVAAIEGMTPARQRILDALAMLRSWGISSADKTQLAFLGDASPTSSAFHNNLGGLRSAGLIDYQGGRVLLTVAGTGVAYLEAQPVTSAELQAMVRTKVSPAKWRILDVLIKAYPRAIERPALAEFSGASATSSAFHNNLGSLRSLGLIDYQSGGVVALPLLFLEHVA